MSMCMNFTQLCRKCLFDNCARPSLTSQRAVYLHGVDEHAREAEGDLLGELLARHGHLEAVAEVDVDDLAAQAVQHQVRRVPVDNSTSLR